MKSQKFLTLVVSALAFMADCKMPAATVWLDDLDVGKTIQDWGDPQKNKSVDGHRLTIGGKEFEHGLGTHAKSTLYISLNGAAKSFSASVGVDGEITDPSDKSAVNENNCLVLLLI